MRNGIVADFNLDNLCYFTYDVSGIDKVYFQGNTKGVYNSFNVLEMLFCTVIVRKHIQRMFIER